jgi:hypothetical protein
VNVLTGLFCARKWHLPLLGLLRKLPLLYIRASENMLDDIVEELKASMGARAVKRPQEREIKRFSVLDPKQAPAPQIQAVIASQGAELFKQSINAWENRIRGVPIVDIAADMQISIETAKALIKQAQEAVSEDLKEALAVNRELDLARLDGLIRYWYPLACQGDEGAAGVVLKCVGQRAKLTGAEALPEPGRQSPANVLVWIQNQLPSINRIVDSLPVE